MFGSLLSLALISFYSRNAAFGCPAQNQYGTECRNCSTACENELCNPETGACLRCHPGFTGNFCNQSCAVNTYGKDCVMTCGFCKDERTCNHIHGSCAKGCTEGWFGEKCDIPCEFGYHGVDCNEVCSLNCLYQECDRFTGNCTFGCIPEYQGPNCQTRSSLDSQSALDGAILGYSVNGIFVFINVVLGVVFGLKFVKRQNERRRVEPIVITKSEGPTKQIVSSLVV
ncbi:scavenger receptor class F member 1-like [Ostrea edulis]|uniref:scavenger receptor class F member 1-like n=1 Tax=Ostrea edulis TaxID=37623 RepID=UPI0024AECD99|nr:scavenger receptor class F member 1-like [Ostrea edulis]